VSVFICHPLTTRASVGCFAFIAANPAAGASWSAFWTTGSALSGLKLWPASSPSRRMRATTAWSVMCGGCSFISSAA
jgi:hypothetical protein